jgi:hypothetical protein
MGEFRVTFSALRYDAECNREVAASMRARAERARVRALEMREENAAVRAESALTLAQSRRLARKR